MKETGSLFCGHQWSYFPVWGRDKKNTAGQKALAWININKSSSLFLLAPRSWKHWVVGRFISRKRARRLALAHIVSMTAIYFAGGRQQVCVIEWRLIDKNNRERCFSIWNWAVEMRHTLALPPGRSEYQWQWVWAVGTNSTLQWSAPSSLYPLCIPSHSPFSTVAQMTF